MKNRDRQRANRRMKEERLNRTTEWGISDPTPSQAVDNLIARERMEQRRMIAAAKARVKAQTA